MGCSSSSQKKSPLTTRITKSSALQSKVVFLGDSGVGKSSILLRFDKDIFSEDHNVTIGGAYLERTLTLKNNIPFSLHLWDTAGGEQFRNMAPIYYRNASAALLVYDVGESTSFQSMQYWLTQLDSNVKGEGMIVGLVGNKCDLPENKKQISRAMGQGFADNHNLIFAETSAKSGEGIQMLFQKLTEQIYDKMEKK